MMKYNKTIFFLKISIKNGMRPIHRCILYAEKYSKCSYHTQNTFRVHSKGLMVNAV